MISEEARRRLEERTRVSVTDKFEWLSAAARELETPRDGATETSTDDAWDSAAGLFGAREYATALKIDSAPAAIETGDTNALSRTVDNRLVEWGLGGELTCDSNTAEVGRNNPFEVGSEPTLRGRRRWRRAAMMGEGKLCRNA